MYDAICANKRVILTKDTVTGDGEAFQRIGYIGVYQVDNLAWENDVMEFDLVKRIWDLK